MDISKLRIIADSGCDLTESERFDNNLADSIPFILQIGSETIIDEPHLDINVLVSRMKSATAKMTTACASPQSWKDAFIRAGGGFAVTLSSKLSGMHQSAVIGLDMAKEEINGLIGHVFDSKSASCGEALVAMKLREYMKDTPQLDTLIKKVEQFVDNMKTLFVLDDIGNLVRNGRMSKLTGTIVGVLGIKPLLGAKDGEIELFGKVRGANNIAARLVEAIERTGRVINGDTLVISHCRNPKLANEIAERANKFFKFGRTHIEETGGLSTFYASDKGVIISF